MAGDVERRLILETVPVPVGRQFTPEELYDIKHRIETNHRPRYPGADIHFDPAKGAIVGTAPPRFGSWPDYVASLRRQRATR